MIEPSFPRPNFSREVIDEAKQKAIAAFPKESCGLIVAGKFIECENTAENPETDFRIDPKHIIEAGAALEAVIHSHPKPFSSSPTAADMRAQMDTGVIWGIIPCNEIEAHDPVYWGDFQLEQPLIGRDFVHGVVDCYTLVRAWYWQNRGIKLPDVPRDDEWWKSGEDLYASFEKFGFKQITMREAKEGDAILGRVRSKVSNHAGIIVGRGLVMHHIMNRMSRREPVGPWLKHITHWLRYEG